MNPHRLEIHSLAGRFVLILGLLGLASPGSSHAQTLFAAAGPNQTALVDRGTWSLHADESVDGGTGNASNASRAAPSPPVIIKAFGAAAIPLNGSTTLTFTIQNNNTATTLTGVGFADTIPAGLVIATPNGLTGTCGGGTITAAAGTNLVSLSGASLVASSSCTFSVTTTGIVAGTQQNTTGNVTSVEGGTGGTASAVLSVVAPPSIAEAFYPAEITVNTTSSLTFTITNPAANTVPLTGVAFTDVLPTGLTVASASATICGGTVTTTAPSGISLSAATIAANSQCQFSVTVTGTTAGSYTDVTGSVTSTNGGTGNIASASITVALPPDIAKSFGAAGIPINGTTPVTFAITNPNTAVSLTGLAFTDNLPAGLVVAGTPGTANTCGGTVTATAGASSIALAGGTLASSAACSVSVNVQGTSTGIKNNSVLVTATNSVVGNTSNASLTVIGPPVIIKAFGAAAIPLNGSTTLTFTIQNNNTTTTLTGVGFADTLPAGLVIATPNGLTGTCGGGTITAAAGTNLVSLSGASLAASSSCTFSVTTTGIAAGTQQNTTGNVTSVEGGTGGTASAALNVVAPPSIAKAFNPAAIGPNTTTSLTFTITNPAANAVPLTGVAFTDVLPASLAVASPNGLTNTCGGTATASAASGTISLNGGAIATNSNCTVGVSVTSSAAGSFVNTTGSVSSTNGGTGNTATATLTVAPADLSIAKSHVGTFDPGQIGAVWTIAVTNVGAAPTAGTVTVVDTLPSIPNPPVATAMSGTGWTCTLATLSCTRSDALAPGAAFPDISVTVNIPTNIQTTFTNRAVVSGGGDVNAANDTASDTVSLSPDLTIAKSHVGTFDPGQIGAVWTIAVSNAGAGPTAGTVTVVDSLPSIPNPPVATAMGGTGWTCTLASLTCTRSDTLPPGAAFPDISVTVNIPTNIQTTFTNRAAVSGGGDVNAANDTASDATSLTVPADFTLSIVPDTATVVAGQSALVSVTVTPQNGAFTNPVALTVSGLPSNTSAVFTPSSVTPGANPATSSLEIVTAAHAPLAAPDSKDNRPLFYALLLLSIGLVLARIRFYERRLRTRRRLIAWALVGIGIGLYACGGAPSATNPGTPPGTYRLTISATAGTVQHTAPATLIVQP